MARIKRETAKHLLVGYRPRPGEDEVYWSCPNRDMFEKFNKYEAACKSAGIPADHRQMLKGATALAALPTAVSHTVEKEAAPQYNLKDWIGDPKHDKPGPFFGHMGWMSKRQRCDYQAYVRNHAAAIAERPMAEVGRAEVRELLRSMLVCPACLGRARTAGEPTNDLLRFSVTEVPWDGACLDPNDEPDHYPMLQTASIERILTMLGAAWAAALRAKDEEVPETQAVVRNPFKGVEIPLFADRPDNNDRVQALSHGQICRQEAAMPEWLAAIIPVTVDGMLRRSEVVPLDRGSIQWVNGRCVVTITAFAAERGHQVTVGTTGKNETSTNKIIYLTESTSNALRIHLETFCSTPNPHGCAACRAGNREHVGPVNSNPHKKCDFANSTRLWRSPESGLSPHPSTVSRIVKAAAVAAGLTKDVLGFVVTFKLLRATGATLMLEAGIAPELVQRQGGWSDADTMFTNYNRIRSETMRNAVDLFERSRRLALHQHVEDVTTTEQLTSLALVIDELRAENEILRRALGANDGVRLRPQQRVSACEPRTTKFTDEAMRAAVTADQNRLQILTAIGVSPTKKNYERLEKRAAELGLELPERWATAKSRSA